MVLSRAFHEQLQEVITWGGTLMTLGALYYLFVAPARIEAGAPRRIPVKDFLDIKQNSVIPGLYPASQDSGKEINESTQQLR